MNKASSLVLPITFLDDEYHCLLMARQDGPLVFGIFIQILMLGKERLLQEKASRIPGTDSLEIQSGLSHILLRAHLNKDQLERCLLVLAEVANEIPEQPWLYLNEAGRLTIRTFFYEAPVKNHGGHRSGAGRPAKKIREEIKINQVELDSENQVIQVQLDSGPEKIKINQVRLENNQVKLDYGIQVIQDKIKINQDTRAPGIELNSNTKKEKDFFLVSTNGSEPIPEAEVQEAEKSDPKKPSRNSPQDVSRVAETADRLFVLKDYGIKVHQLAESYDVNVLEQAMIDVALGKIHSWPYINGVYKNRVNEGKGNEKSIPVPDTGQQESIREFRGPTAQELREREEREKVAAEERERQAQEAFTARRKRLAETNGHKTA